jgi:hypothetical protein
MSKSLKAALLSAFIFPGVGHFFLKKYVQGLLLAGIATVCLYLLLVTTIAVAQEISDKILSGEISMDIVRITEAISIQLANSSIQQINITTSLFFICWLVSIIDSYRLGYIEDKGDRSSDEEVKG